MLGAQTLGASMLGDDGTAPAIVDADRRHVDVLADRISPARSAAGNAREAQHAVAHEQVLVFGGDRPVLGKADLDAGADSSTPTRGAGLVEHRSGRRGEAVVLLACDRGAALHVPEHVVPGIADLAGKHADAVDLGLIGHGRDELAGVGALDVGPVALAFGAEDPAASLPAIADLATGRRAGRIVAAFGVGRGDPGKADVVGPAGAGRCAAGIQADIEAAPI